jgi:PTS system N-acetylglucosamine-specific IIA component
VKAPVPGRAVPLSDVPDPVFSEQMVGPGAAVDPPREVVDAVAPIDGTLVKAHPHAFVVQSEGGLAVLVHLGIDTVQLAGEHFTVLAQEGSQVSAGEVVTRWDTAAVEAGGRNPIVPVIVLDQPQELVLLGDAVTTGGEVAAGDPLLAVTCMPTTARAAFTPDP